MILGEERTRNSHIKQESALTGYSEAWRYTGPFTRRARYAGALPGLGYGTAAFAVYLVYEQITKKNDHGHGHEEGHH